MSVKPSRRAQDNCHFRAVCGSLCSRLSGEFGRRLGYSWFGDRGVWMVLVYQLSLRIDRMKGVVLVEDLSEIARMTGVEK